MRIYLDYNATTPVDREVWQAMLPYFAENFGNAGSIHTEGQRGRYGVDRARDQVAALLGAKPSEIVFTSGGTEADNLAIFGIVRSAQAAGRTSPVHIITSSIEHHAVLNACQELAKQGIDVTFLPVSPNGLIDPQEVRRTLRPETVLISVMHANNEIGTIQPIEEIAKIAAEADVHFHCDAVQSAGKLSLDVHALGVDLLSISAHKIYGPKGVGALYVRKGTPLEPLFYGGHQERDLRGGTENVAGIVGLGAAAELARKHLAEDSGKIALLRDRLEASLLSAIPHAHINGDRHRRVANTTNFTFTAAGGEALVIALDLQGVAVSTGAACSSGAVEPSHVLLALGLSPDEARSSIRISLGRSTTREEIDRAIAIIPQAVERLRALSPRSAAPVPVS